MRLRGCALALVAAAVAVAPTVSLGAWRDNVDHALVTTIAGYMRAPEGTVPYIAEIDFYVSAARKLGIEFKSVSVNNQPVPMPEQPVAYIVDLEAGSGNDANQEETYTYSALESGDDLAVTIDYQNAVSGAAGQMIFEINFASGSDCTVKLTGAEDNVTFDLRSAACTNKEGAP
jgi:hypothetical protein